MIHSDKRIFLERNICMSETSFRRSHTLCKGFKLLSVYECIYQGFRVFKRRCRIDSEHGKIYIVYECMDSLKTSFRNDSEKSQTCIMI